MLAINHNPYRRVVNSFTPRRMAWVVVLAIGLLAPVAAVAWYQWALAPRDAAAKTYQHFVVEAGEGASVIGRNLEAAGLIRSAVVFSIYVDRVGAKEGLQAGAYALSPHMPVSEIAESIRDGKTSDRDVTILPGMTLRDLWDDDGDGSLVRQGYGRRALQVALTQQYDHPLLSTKPAGMDLEGYVFPETYRVSGGSTAEELVTESLDELYRAVQKHDIESRLTAKGLSLHQGVTLASIIQREVSDEAEQRQVAQVFLKRLAEGMELGSDPTFIYAAERDGKTPTISYDSPYNTRRYKGVPPGPIGTFNLSALLAVVDPAPGDYLYFAAGDDHVTRFARTLEEHEANVAQYGQERSREFSN